MTTDMSEPLAPAGQERPAQSPATSTRTIWGLRRAMATSRSARAVAGTAVGWARTGVTVLLGLTCTPLVLRWLGPERFGAVRMGDQWFAYLELLTFGLGATVGVLLMKAASSDSPGDLTSYTRAGFGLLARQLRWVFPAAVVLALAFPYAFDLSSELRAEYSWAIPAILLGVCLIPFGAFRSAIEARQKNYLFQTALIAQAVVVSVLAVASAWAGFGLTGQLWVALIGTVVLNGLLAYWAGGLNRSFWATPAPALARADVWRLQWPLLVAGIGNQINLLSDNLLAGALFGVVQVTAFVLTQRLVQMMVTFAGAVNGTGSWTGLVDLRARCGPQAFADRVAEVSKLNVGVNLMLLAPALGYNARFVGLWVGSENYAGDWVTAATYLQIAVFNFFCLYAALLDLFGATRKRVWMSTFGTILKLALIVPLTRWLGLAGLPLATAAGYLCTDAWFCPWVVCRDYAGGGRRIVAGLIRAVAVGGAWAAVCYLVGTRTSLVRPGWAGLIAEVAALEICGAVLAWTALLSASDRAVWRARVRSWLGRTAAPAAGET